MSNGLEYLFVYSELYKLEDRDTIVVTAPRIVGSKSWIPGPHYGRALGRGSWWLVLNFSLEVTNTIFSVGSLQECMGF